MTEPTSSGSRTDTGSVTHTRAIKEAEQPSASKDLGLLRGETPRFVTTHGGQEHFRRMLLGRRNSEPKLWRTCRGTM